MRRGLFIVWFALAGCAPHFERPVVTVAGVDLQKGSSLSQQTLLVHLHVQNPNDRSIPVSGLHADVTVDGDRIASGESTQAFVVPARGETDFDMTITANMALALLRFATHPHADSVNYQITGSANLALPFLHEVPFTQTGTLPLRTGAR
jgi:LEA14-like dessication related protein